MLCIFFAIKQIFLLIQNFDTSNSAFHKKLRNLDTIKADKEWEIFGPSEEENNEPTTINPYGKHILKYLRNLLLWNMESDQIPFGKGSLKKKGTID